MNIYSYGLASIVEPYVPSTRPGGTAPLLLGGDDAVAWLARASS